MSSFKCKMCGGTIEFEPGATIGICDHCGTKQTLPRLDDDRRANLYDRANHLRRSNDFDKAASLYEQILAEDNTDAEAYWSLVLCRYGIEYVEDPKTHQRVPTVNRVQYTSIYDDDNYRSALVHSDTLQKNLYEREADAINKIQKEILAISRKEEPFDIFICYKEADADGRRTPDSVLANDLYHQLTQEGFKVFFSRITLEDKLGSAYEPYIFAALNSAKVMVVVGTKPEYFNAVWVKNEWSRYLALVKTSNGKKVLIPAYRDMNPYDLPDEFSHLMAQDMSKLGFMQDLIRGIKKIIGDDIPKAAIKENTIVNAGGAQDTPLLKRVFLFLEDGDWEQADEYCEKVLDMDPESALAYVGKLMAELHVRKIEELKYCSQPFDDRNNYKKILRFANPKLKKTMEGYVSFIKFMNEESRKKAIYERAKEVAGMAYSEQAWTSAADFLQPIAEYEDSEMLIKQYRKKAEDCRKDAIYQDGLLEMTADDIPNLESAIRKFERISEWKDASNQINLCRQRIAQINRKREEKERLAADRAAEQKRIAEQKAAERKEKITRSTLMIVIAFIVTSAFLFAIKPMLRNNQADIVGSQAAEGDTTPTPTPEPTPELFTISVIGDETLTTHQNLSDESPYSYAGRMKGDYSYPFKNTAQYFKNDEFTITNLECSLCDDVIYSTQTFYFRAPTANAQILIEGGIDFVTTANNHSLDFGQAGLISTYNALEEYGIAYGKEDEAQVITTEHGLKIGVYCAYNDFIPSVDKASAAIAEMRAEGADYIICAFHWGQELYYEPNASQVNIGRACIDAGADLIFGCHSHCLQPIEEYNGGIILYSMGEFTFGGSTSPTDRDTAIFQLTLKRDLDGTISVEGWDVVPCCVSSCPAYEGYTADNYNDFCPTPYEVGSEDYYRVLSKLDGSYQPTSQGTDYSNWYASYG